MMVERQMDGECQPEHSGYREPYTPPVLLIVGNLKDLLAGGGTATNDSGTCEPGGSLSC